MKGNKERPNQGGESGGTGLLFFFPQKGNNFQRSSSLLRTMHNNHSLPYAGILNKIQCFHSHFTDIWENSNHLFGK